MLRRRGVLLGALGAALAGCDDRLVAWRRGALGLVVTDDHLYWLSGSDHAAVVRAPREGGEPKVIHDRMVGGVDMVAAGDALYVASARGIERVLRVGVGGKLLVPQPEGAHRLVVDGQGITWLDRRRGLLRRSDRAGGEVLTLAEGPGWGQALAQHGERLYWAAGEPSEITTVATFGGPRRTLLRRVMGVTDLLAVDEHLHVAHAAGILRVPLAGGEAETVVKRRGAPGMLVALDRGICWSERDRIVSWRDGRVAEHPAGQVLALASEGASVWWMDAKAKGLRHHRWT